MITIKVYRNGNRLKSLYADSPNGIAETTYSEVFDTIRSYPEHDFIFIDKQGNDITYEMLMRVLKTVERDSVKPPFNLTNTIRGGGFINYINKLETQL